MSNLLPTLQHASWTATEFYDSFVNELRSDRRSSELRLYFYAVTQSGWRLIQKDAKTWLKNLNNRKIKAYVGTDHGLTDPNALKDMQKAGVNIKLLMNYNGIFHPKVVWFFQNKNRGKILFGSNNLSDAGLKYNIEFASLVNLSQENRNLSNWHEVIDSCSEDLTADLLKSYLKEKEEFGEKRAKTNTAGSFTWSKRRGAKKGLKKFRGKSRSRRLDKAKRGDLILEIMNRETGMGGSQIQIPMDAAWPFFHLDNHPKASTQISLTNKQTSESRKLTMTRFANHTTRLVIHELDYRDRPCFILFRRMTNNKFTFEIIKKSIEPDLYKDLLVQCSSTRRGSRRWRIR